MENTAGTELRAGVAVAEGAGAAVRGRDSGYYSLEGGVEVAKVADDAGVDTDADADENTPAEDSGEVAGVGLRFLGTAGIQLPAVGINMRGGKLYFIS